MLGFAIDFDQSVVDDLLSSTAFFTASAADVGASLLCAMVWRISLIAMYWVQSVAHNNYSPVQLFGLQRPQNYGSKSHPGSQSPRGFSIRARDGVTSFSAPLPYALFSWCAKGLRYVLWCRAIHLTYDLHWQRFSKFSIYWVLPNSCNSQ